MYNPDYHGILNQGWICGRCNRSFAPFVSECPYCNSARSGFATTTNPATIDDSGWWEDYLKQSQTGQPVKDTPSTTTATTNIESNVKVTTWNNMKTSHVEIGKDGSIMWSGPVPDIVLNSILD